MSSKDVVRKSLQGNIKFNPFNEKYSSIELDDFLEKYKKVNNEADNYGISIALATRCYNSYYNELMEFIKMKKKLLDNDCWGIIQTVLAIANREHYLLKKNILFKTPIASIQSIANLEVESSIDHFQSMNVISAIEIQIEIANILINVLRYSMNSTNSYLISEKNKVKEVIKMYGTANILYYIKESYDTALWENGYISMDGNKYHIKYTHADYPIARRIGDIRMQNNILGTFDIMQSMAKNLKIFNESLFKKKRKARILENVWLDSNGYIQYSLKLGSNNAESEETYAMSISQIDTYYPYMTDNIFSSINNLCLKDLIIMFSKISALIVKINDIYMKERIDDEHLNKFLYKIKVGMLRQYLKDTTEFTKKQINSFFELIESRFENNSRINLWTRPALRVEDKFYFFSTNIVAPNYSFLVDEWLDSIGYDLKERGKDFERYIKRELNKCLSKRNFSFKIADKSKFYINENDFEEIDLLINLKNIVIIGEVKCIKYPMSSRDSYNNFKRLREASKQIKRKEKYIYKNRNHLFNDIGDIENKKIVRVIISNYAIFAGTNVDEIPVIDYFLFDSYIRSGKLTHRTISKDNGKYEEILEEIDYYSNEDEFCNNFEEFIKRPPSINEIKNSLTLAAKELTLPNSSIHIYQDFVKDASNNAEIV